MNAIKELKKNISVQTHFMCAVEYKSLVDKNTLDELHDKLHKDVNIEVTNFLL
jgi:hypothetical protein